MKILLLLLTVILSVSGVKSQEYMHNFEISINPDAQITNHFGLTPFFDENSELYGYKRDGKIVIPAKYRYTQGFSKKGIARVTNQSPYSKETITPILHGEYSFLNIYKDNCGLNGFIDTLGNVVIPLKYSSIGAIEVYGVATFSMFVSEDGKRVQKYGLMNDKGDVVVDAKYDFIYQCGKIFEVQLFSKNSEKDTYYYIDEKGEKLEDGGRFDKFIVLSEMPPRLFYVENNGFAFLLNEDLNSVVSPCQIMGRGSEILLKRLINSYIDRYGQIIKDVSRFL